MGKLAKLTQGEVKFWINEAKSCEKRQKIELEQRNNYPTLVKYYEGFEVLNLDNPNLTIGQTQQIINDFFPNTNNIIAEIIYQNPDIIVSATRQDFESNEDLMKAAILYGFKKAKAIDENRVAFFDMIYSGYGCIEVGHLNEAKESNLLPSDEVMKDREKSFVDKIKEKAQGLFGNKNTDTEKEIETNFAKNTPEKEIHTATNEGTYFKRWSPLNVPLDWMADTITERRYNLKKIWMSRAEFDAKYPQFKNKISSSSSQKLDYAAHDNKQYAEKILLYEFQICKKSGKYGEYWNLIVSPDYTQEEIDFYKRPYDTNGFNMKIGMLHKYGALYPVSLAQINKVVQDEKNDYVKFMDDVARRNIPKRAYDKNKVKIDGVAALNSPDINASVPVDGSPQGAFQDLPATNVSADNTNMLAILQQRGEVGWGISQARLSGKSDAEFMGEMEIQESGFKSRSSDIQEGLRLFIKEQIETEKDIIVTYWDGEYFFKVTSGQKPVWYESQTVPHPFILNEQMVENPLTEILTADFECDVDISSMFKPNTERKKKEMADFLAVLISPAMSGVLQAQGKMINIEVIKKAAQDAGFNGETIFVDIAQAPMTGIPGEIPSQAGIPGEQTELPPEVMGPEVQPTGV